MYKTIIILYAWIACAISMLPIGRDDPRDSGFTDFDYELHEKVLDPELCEHQLKSMASFEFYDASFRMPQGMSQGNMVSMGNFYQCLGIKQDAKRGAIEGKYCMVVAEWRGVVNFPVLAGIQWLADTDWMELNLNLTNNSLKNLRKTFRISSELGRERQRTGGKVFDKALSLALCIPKPCTVDHALGPGFDYIDHWTEFCRLPGDKPLVAADYTAIGIFSVIGILAILSTAYDLLHRVWFKKDPFEINELLRCWSVYSNTKSLMAFRSNPGTIHCIDGITSVSVIWVIVGHTVINFVNKYTTNVSDLWEWSDLRRNIWLKASPLSMDTFFTLSGLLLVYTTSKKTTQMQLLKNLHMLYLHRLLRMFPLLACAVLLQASVFHHVSDGVDWHYMAYFVQMCRDHWWSALLHIQNITNPLDYCLPHGWYLSVDVQLHILSPLILFWALGSRRAAWSGLALGVSVLVIASTVYIFWKDLDDGYNFDVYYYRNPLTRCQPFLVGMVTGYILHIFRDKKVKLCYWIIGLGYIISLALALYCLYSFDNELEQAELQRNFNRSFVRGLWSLSVCWLIFACDQGYGGTELSARESHVSDFILFIFLAPGPINRLLSLTIWKFTARISYAMYLFHYSIIWAISRSYVTPFYFTVGSTFLMITNVMVNTVIVSVAACILVDGPCRTLQKMLRKALAVVLSKSITRKVTPTTREELGSGDGLA